MFKYLLLVSFITHVGWSLGTSTPADEVAFYKTNAECIAAAEAYDKENLRVLDKATKDRTGNWIEARGYCTGVRKDTLLKTERAENSIRVLTDALKK